MKNIFTEMQLMNNSQKIGANNYPPLHNSKYVFIPNSNNNQSW